MSVAIAEERPKASALLGWLQFDAERIPAVEEAYRTFLTRANWGVYFCAAIFFGILGAAATLVVGRHAYPLHRLLAATVVWTVLFYGIQALALLRVPKDTLRTMLVGAVDWRRACLAAAGMGLASFAVEMGAAAALLKMHAKPGPNVDVFAGGVAFAILSYLVLAPVIEEFLMQGWLQSRLLRFGGKWAAVLTTVAFLLLHVPTTLFATVRALGLGCAAFLRGTTRSMAASITVHVVSNACVLLVVAVARTMEHHR